MSAQEIRAAAERLRRIHNGESVEAVYGQPYTTSHSLYQYDHPYHADLRAALGDWLAAVSHNDSKPLDEAFLRSALTELDEGVFRGVNEHGLEIFVWTDGTVNFGDVDCRMPLENRGALRRFCAALAIPLKEPSL